jgi:3'-5' exoribonuclease
LKALLRAFLDDPEIASGLSPGAGGQGDAPCVAGRPAGARRLADGRLRTRGETLPEVHRDLLLTGAVLHDIGKLHELVWKKSFDYTIQGQLLGHITIGYGMIERRSSNRCRIFRRACGCSSSTWC